MSSQVCSNKRSTLYWAVVVVCVPNVSTNVENYFKTLYNDKFGVLLTINDATCG